MEDDEDNYNKFPVFWDVFCPNVPRDTGERAVKGRAHGFCVKGVFIQYFLTF